jgi:hypothetical protein
VIKGVLMVLALVSMVSGGFLLAQEPPQEPEPEHAPSTMDEPTGQEIDIADVTTVTGYYGNTEELGPADLNGDGEVDIADVTTVTGVYGAKEYRSYCEPYDHWHYSWWIWKAVAWDEEGNPTEWGWVDVTEQASVANVAR